MATGSETNYIILVMDEEDDYFRIPLEGNALKESVLNDLFPQAAGMYFKDINNTRTLVVKKGDSYTEPVDGWKGETRKYYLLKKIDSHKEKIRSLAEAIRSEKAGQNKRKSFQPPNVNVKSKKKEADVISVRFQWMHYNESKFASKKGYKQVLHCDGGGLREFQMNRDVKFDEILQKAKDIYFPNGKSQKGSIEDMSLEMSDFTLKPLKRFTNLNEQECTYKTHLSCRGLFPSRSAVILMTRKNKTVNDTENTEPISQQSLQTSADDRLSSCTSDMGESIETSIPCNTMPRITVKYSKVKQSIYCSDTVSISITGRDQVKAFIQREHGEEVPDPLDYDFTVQHIKKDGKVYLDTALTQDMLKDTVLGLEPMEMKGPEENKLNFVFPSATADSTSTIIHGPNEIFGVDGEELVIGVVCRNYGKELIYRWFKDDQMIKYGTNPSLIKVSQNGTYFCEVKDETTGKTQKSEKIVFKEVKLSAKDEVQDTPPLIPIIALSDLQFSKTDELGKGAFARVYKGSWIGSSVAIKVVDLKKRSKTKIQGMVEEEIKIHSKIRHPNIVQLMAVAYDVRSIFLVSEFIDGFNMEDMIFDENVKNRLTVTIQNKLYISMQCLQAISYLHGMENPIIHRDVKPANILIDHKSLTTKLCDLGVSRVKSYTSYSLTNIGGQPGTPAYMAPEVILQGKSATKKSDIWSIGTSLVELFVEEEAWGDLDTPEDIKEVMQKRKPPVALEKVTEPVKNILANCLKYVPEDRPDALEVLLAIRKHV